MSAALQAVRDELTALRARIEPLAQAEALLAPLYEPKKVEQGREAKPKQPAGKQRARRRRRKATPGGNPSREQIRDYVIAHGPVPRKVLLAALGGHPRTMDNNLKRLLKAGEIEADTAPGGRLYRAPRSGQGSSSATASPIPPTGPRATIAGPTEQPAPGVYPVLDAIDALGTATTEQLMDRLGLEKPVVVTQCQRLRQLALIEVTAGPGDKPVWVRAAARQSRAAA
jgi:hypothetical protein